ncbi:MAG: transporter substrate-binding domain-containing protein, partial [Spirochaetota bacterium]
LASGVAGDSLFLLSRRNKLFDNPQDYIIVGEPLSYAPFGIVLPENDSEWKDFINLTLNEMFNNGEFEKIYNKWFGPGTEYDMSSLGWKPEVWP